jgi:hypothetical protein
LPQFFADANGQKVKRSLERAHKKVAKKRKPKTRKKYIDANGSRKWKPIKDWLTLRLGSKCWYTEFRLIGAPLVVDHYRPVCDYWWLAFDPENYRIACPWANSPEHNSIFNRPGGKADNFPLMPPAVRATRKNELPTERPVILDPCIATDCDLLAFRADGHPILNPAFAADPVAVARVEHSKLLLNLNHGQFNSDREQLCNAIADDVRIHEALPFGSPERMVIRARVEQRLTPQASFSTAARFYLKLHRHLDWVENLLNTL